MLPHRFVSGFLMSGRHSGSAANRERQEWEALNFHLHSVELRLIDSTSDGGRFAGLPPLPSKMAVHNIGTNIGLTYALPRHQKGNPAWRGGIGRRLGGELLSDPTT